MRARPPLDGIRILAVSQFGAGPFGTSLLADLGAEVIKIEDPTVDGDVARYVPPFLGERDSLFFQAFNRGKKSVALNLQHPEGRAVFHDLVRVSDAVYNNLRGDQPAKLGLTYETLKTINPRIVCCSLTGFGLTGPRQSEPGYDPLIQGLAGYMSVTGEPDDPPAKCGVSITDFAGGYVSALGLMVALFDRQRTGAGRDVDVSLLDTAIHMLSYFATWTLNREWEPVRTPDSSHQTLVPSQNFRTADAWIVIICAKEKFYQNLVEALGLPHLARDPRFATFPDRLAHKGELIPILQAHFQAKTTQEWLGLLRGKVPCAPINSVRAALNDEQVLARGMIIEVKHPVFGTLREVACPIKTEGAIAHPAPGPGLGEHTDQILRDTLGYPLDRVVALQRAGVIG